MSGPTYLLGTLLSLLGWLAAACPPPVSAQDVPPEGALRLEEGWAYRWGGATMDLLPPGTTEREDIWETAPTLLNPPGAAQEILWLRTRLPDRLPDDAVLFVPVVFFSFEAYVDGVSVYRHGAMGTGEAVRYGGYRGHLVPLPPDAGGRVFAMRIYSPDPQFIGLFVPPYVAPEADILRLALRERIDHTAIGLLFIVIGLLSLMIYLRRRREPQALLPLYFGIFTLSVGLAIFGDSFARRLFFPSPAVWYYLFSIGFFLFPVGLLGFFEQVVGAGYRSIVRRLWQVHLAFVALALVLDTVGLMMMVELRRLFFGLLILTVLVMVIGGIVAVSKGGREAKAFGVGVLVAALTGLHDTIFLGFEVDIGRPQISAWGMLVFVACMGYILERRFFENLRQLRVSSRELEIQSGALRTAYTKLEEYNTTLEQRVEERTQELSRKNEELEEKNERLAEALRRLREAQEKLVMREKLASLGQLTAGIAHEIKNPLNFVNNFAHLSIELIDEVQAAFEAQRDGLAPEAAAEIDTVLHDLRQSAEKIHHHGQRADSIVRNMMLHARGTTQERQPTNLHAVLDEYANLAYHGMRASVPGFSVSIERDYDSTVDTVPLIPQEFGRVVLNLLSNAFYAVHEKATALEGTYRPRVALRTRRHGGGVEIRVEDNGVGIPEAMQGRVFEPFFTTKPAGSGTGLGLSLSYDIVTQGHGGTLEVESVDREGATFVIRLPLAERRPAGVVEQV